MTGAPPTDETLRRVVMLSVHTSPLAQPGTGDAGGLNVYVVESARELARRGTEVEILTRRTAGDQPDRVELTDGVVVRHVDAGPYEGLAKEDLPGQLCAFTAGTMRLLAHEPEGAWDVVHSHYWLSGQVGWVLSQQWDVPLVHTMHTMARVKNLHLADGDAPEPPGREIGEAQVVGTADRLVANTPTEARELIDLYEADPDRVVVVPPGVDLGTFHPADRAGARAAVGIAPDAVLLLFVGRIQPLKAPDVLVRAAADLLARRPELRERLVVGILGGGSGSGLAMPRALADLARDLGVPVRFEPPVDRPTLAQWYRAADLVAVPSHSESFGLVAVEAQACGTPVVAADVGGLSLAVGDAGVLVDGHDPARWSAEIEGLVGRLSDQAQARRLRAEAAEHARTFGWDRTAGRLLDVYRGAVRERARREHRRWEHR